MFNVLHTTVNNRGWRQFKGNSKSCLLAIMHVKISSFVETQAHAIGLTRSIIELSPPQGGLSLS
jgi:hypothetical protein